MIKWKKEKGTDLSIIGLIVTLGIVYGDLGTSPLYTMKAIMHTISLSSYPLYNFVIGALSCLFWTLTLQTTIKYVFITLKANNKGEGGIFLLFTLIRNRKKWAYLIAIIGACALLGDGIITPAITVTSAVEGLERFFPDINVVLVVITILSVLFFSQRFGTASLGKYFGPIMLLWFSMLLILGIISLFSFPEVIKAINPYYAIELIVHYPFTLVLLGAIFLVTTGAEALYSDLGHCGLRNIRITWIFVKISLVLNYFGQGAWILSNANSWNNSINPFFAIMPHWFLPYGVLLATLAAIIASQALISGSYTIISEAISLNFFPKIRINYPTDVKGQMYIPWVNKTLWILCVFVVLFFQTSTKMEAAYGLSITIAMLMTTILLTLYLRKKYNSVVAFVSLLVFMSIEMTFLFANLTKFYEGGWFSLLLCGVFISIMYTWNKGSFIENSFVKYISLEPFKPIFKDLSLDTTVPKYSTNLVYFTKSKDKNKIEDFIMYSIFVNKVKRADMYWILHVNNTDDPYQLTYDVTQIIEQNVYRIDMNIGFKIEPKINLYFREILENFSKEGLYTTSRYPSLSKYSIKSDFRYVITNQIKNNDFDFPFLRQLMMDYFYFIKQRMVNKIKSMQLDASKTKIEYIPIQSSSIIFEDGSTSLKKSKYFKENKHSLEEEIKG